MSFGVLLFIVAAIAFCIIIPIVSTTGKNKADFTNAKHPTKLFPWWNM